MKYSIYSLMALSACFFSSILYSQNEIVDKTTNVSFPREVSFDYNGKQYQLDATGVATRKKLIINVYSIAHYLQKNAKSSGDIMQTILSDDNAKQFTMKWLRFVPADKIHETYEESFHKTFSGQDFARHEAEINQFLQFFQQPAQEGDEYVLRWIPGGVVTVSINGNEVGTVTNKEFAKGLWNIWFGQNGVVKRDALLSQVK